MANMLEILINKALSEEHKLSTDMLFNKQHITTVKKKDNRGPSYPQG